MIIICKQVQLPAIIFNSNNLGKIIYFPVYRFNKKRHRIAHSYMVWNVYLSKLKGRMRHLVNLLREVQLV